MSINGITHEFGPWSPMRYIPIPFREGEPPAFWVATSRVCRGAHDWRCTHSETQTFGPLVLEGATAADLTRCDNCHRVQPPPADDQAPRCLYCTDMATVQRTGDVACSTAALSAVAALQGAIATLRQTKEADSDTYLALLAETGDTLRSVLEDASWAIRQDITRAGQTGYAQLALISRQILANARTLADLAETD